MIDDPDDRKLAMQKLEEIMTYCQLDSCRRVYLLNYFGEETDFSECEACDNCVLGPEETVDSTEISQKILSAVLRTGERFGMAHVCDVLRGSKKRRIIELGHDKLSVHGLAKEMPLAELRQYLQGLKRMGYLEKNPGDYPTLRVTGKGRKALKDREEILLPEIHVTKKAAVRKNASNLDFDVELFEQLRTLRKELADKQDVPPFVIFSNKTLYEMAFYLPKNDEDLLKIFGVGEKKLNEFGEKFLACVAGFVKNQ
jgi:ATP-dependent DNA helicase RecQ